jgi:hypothetical protein
MFVSALRKIRALVVVFALVALLTGGLVTIFTDNAEARPACCIWVMYCTQNPPIVCWDVCIPVPCL